LKRSKQVRSSVTFLGELGFTYGYVAEEPGRFDELLLAAAEEAIADSGRSRAEIGTLFLYSGLNPDTPASGGAAILDRFRYPVAKLADQLQLPHANAMALSQQGCSGLLSAINLDRGELTWQVPHGDTPDNVRNHPALKGMTIPRTGQSGAVGLVITKTLVIMGDPQVTTTPDHQRGAMLRAYDKMTGNQVGAVWMPAQQSGSPMTYMLNGRQYIVVAVSGGNYSGEYIGFALPSEAITTSNGPQR